MYRPRISGQESGLCSTCSRGFPVSQLVLTRRYGWQCLPGDGNQGCYDGPVQREEMRYISRPYEGVRRSNAPTYDLATMGVEPGQYESLVVRFRDQTTGIVWNFIEDDFVVSDDQSSNSHGGWIYSSDYRLWVQDSVMYIGKPWPGTYKYIPAPDIGTYNFPVIG